MKDRDNQQEIHETDLAWLAGMIEADGSVGMGFQQTQGAKGKKLFATKPNIAFTNQDALLIEKVSSIIKTITNKNMFIREIKSGFDNGNSSISLLLSGLEAVRDALLAIEPYMVGSKGAKARLLIKYLDSRLSRTRTGQGNPPYDINELVIIKHFNDITKRKGGKRNPDVVKILRDYMCGFGIAGDLEKEIVRAA